RRCDAEMSSPRASGRPAQRRAAPSSRRASRGPGSPQKSMLSVSYGGGGAVLSREDNELITRTGPGTPMGEVMRRYWMPILLEREVAEPDGEPVRVQVLGEHLVAFRDTKSRIGLLEEFCPHRRVSLWLGRNEQCGLRCAYHGWKFDVQGTCVEQMNEPGDQSFAEKVRTTAYPTVEAGGIIWAYLGPKEKMPPPPCFDWVTAP